MNHASDYGYSIAGQVPGLMDEEYQDGLFSVDPLRAGDRLRYGRCLCDQTEAQNYALDLEYLHGIAARVVREA